MNTDYNDNINEEYNDSDFPEGGVFVPGVYDSENLNDGIYIPFIGGNLFDGTDRIGATDLVSGKRYNVVKEAKLLLCSECSGEIEKPIDREVTNLEVVEGDTYEDISPEIKDSNSIMRTASLLCNTLRSKYEIGVLKQAADNVLSTETYMLVFNFTKKEVVLLFNVATLDAIFCADLSNLVTTVGVNFGWTIRIHGTYEVQQ